MAPARCFSGGTLCPSRHLRTELGVSAGKVGTKNGAAAARVPGVPSGCLKRAAAARSPPQAAEEQGGDAPGPGEQQQQGPAGTSRDQQGLRGDLLPRPPPTAQGTAHPAPRPFSVYMES